LDRFWTTTRPPAAYTTLSARPPANCIIFCSQPFNPIIVSILALFSILNIDMISLKAKIEEQLRNDPNCKNKQSSKQFSKGNPAKGCQELKASTKIGSKQKSSKKSEKRRETVGFDDRYASDFKCQELNLRISKGKVIVEGATIREVNNERRLLSGEASNKTGVFQTTLKPGKRVSSRVILAREPCLYVSEAGSTGFRSSRTNETGRSQARGGLEQKGKETRVVFEGELWDGRQSWREERKLKDEVQQYIFGKGQKPGLSPKPPLLTIVPSKSAVFGVKTSKPSPNSACIFRPKPAKTNFAKEYLEPFKTIESPIGQCFAGQGLDSDDRLFSKSNILKTSQEALESNLLPLPPNLLPRPPLRPDSPKSVEVIPEFASTSLITPKFPCGRQTS
jgi:hypothetical protein